MKIKDNIIGLLHSFRKPKWNLVVVGIFKNEASAIVEWMNHYIQEGVDHFFLIDNGSTDDSSQRVTDHFEKHYYTIVHDSKKWAQSELYNKFFLKEKHRCNWMIICDLDEFIYARNGNKTISSFLDTLPSNVGGVKIPWKMFGSNHIEEQPESIIRSFSKRAIYENKQNPGMEDCDFSVCKMIVRSSSLIWMEIHEQKLKETAIIVDASSKEITNNKANFTLTSEALLPTMNLHLNHYALQSKEWFLEVKCTRGAADGEAYENIRNIEYFQQFDRDLNGIDDHELALKRRPAIV